MESRKCLYSDTDSIFFQLQSDEYDKKIEEMDEIKELLNEKYDEFVQQYNKEKREHIRIDKDKMYETWFQADAKKKYIGLLDWKEVDVRDKNYNERLEVTGFESVKIDQANLTKESQEKAFDIILANRPIKDMFEYIQDLYQKVVIEKKRDDDLGREAQLNKPPRNYKTKGAHVRAFEYSKQKNLFDIQIGDTFLWYYTKNDKRVAIPWGEKIPDEIQIDREMMFKKSVFDKIKKLVNPFVKREIRLDMILEGEKQTGVEDFGI